MNTLCYVQLVSDEKAFINSLRSGCIALMQEDIAIAQFVGDIPAIHSSITLQFADRDIDEFYRVIYHQHVLKNWGFVPIEDADPLVPQYRSAYCVVYVTRVN